MSIASSQLPKKGVFDVIVLTYLFIIVFKFLLHISRAARVTKPLGNLLGEFLASLTSRGLSPKKLELVGGSLGAHIASYAADTYRLLTGRRPARLTGSLYFSFNVLIVGR